MPRKKAILILGLSALSAALSSSRAATTNVSWIAASPADFSVASDWDQGLVPAGTNYVALFTNGVACNYYSNSSAVLDSYEVGQMSAGPWNNSTGAFVMNGGSLLVSNALNDYAVTIGGRDGSGGAGGNSLSPSSGSNSVGSFTMNGGSLTVARYGTGYYHQDSFFMGLGTNSIGTFTLNGGTANFLCGVELGVYGAGTVTVNGGAIVDNGWFGVGRGNSSAVGSGTFNLNGGAVYILPNFSGGTVGGTGGLYLNQGCTNSTVNISGGSLYVVDIGFAGSAYSPPPRDTLNVVGGQIYIGFEGIYTTGSSQINSVNISGGTFHTVDMLGVGGGGVAGNTNVDILGDGTNWTWQSPPVNLTNSSFFVNGTNGPGYVTFAPEAGRTITLDNAWSGVGGLTMNGPGALAIGASNSFTGNTQILQGTLALAAGSIVNSSNIIVAPGAILSGSPYTLGVGQTLTNSGSTAVLEGDIGTGSGTVALNYAPGTPAFTVDGGTFGLATSTTFNINNTGATLTSGTYKIISAGACGAVTAPGGSPTVTVSGGGITAGLYASLSISNSELYLLVTSDRPPVANAVTNSLYYGSTWQISISNLAQLAAWSDPDGNPVSFSGVSSTSADGTNVYTDGTNIYYNGTLTSDDSFTYNITDGTLTSIGAVYLNEMNPTAAIPADVGYVTSLDGLWDFYFERTNYNLGSPPNVSLPSDPQQFQLTNYVEITGWTNLQVPGNWEMFGFSPCTYYVPDDTCGLYREWISIPQSWQGRRVYIYFDGVLDGAQIWLNGQPVPVSEPSWNIQNYHESGWTGFQVDLTSQVIFGTTNLLAVRVIKNTPSNDLDTGDYFFMGGIHRPVTLYSVPQTNFADVQIETHLLATNLAEIDVTADVTGGNASTPVALYLNGVETDSTTATNGQALFKETITNPQLWSAEFPNLYRVTVELTDTNGFPLESVANQVGIRELTITNGVLLLNGVPVKFAGVCDHDSSATNGSAVDINFWRREITAMKAANINAIRTTHYPFDSALFEVCDEMGMYVADEFPYCWVSSVNDPNMTPAFQQRARETIRRDRNHPSVVIWAIGNENSAGSNLQVVADLVKSLDATRPRLVSTFNATKYNVELSDAHYPTLPTMQADAINAATSGHPFIFMENPNTSDERLAPDAGKWENWGVTMQRTWNYCQSNTVPGTFPFEWSDRAVQDPNPDSSYLQYKSTGVQLLYYFPATGIHLLKMKGMVDGFRNQRPEVYELQMIYSPVQIVSNSFVVVSTNQVSFGLQNRYSFTDISYLTTLWQLERNGTTIASGVTNISLPPLSNGVAQLSLPANALAYADALRLDFIHPNGNDVYAWQFALTNAAVYSVLNTNLPAGLPIPQFNLITRTNYNNPNYWTECIRFPASLTNVTITPSNATTLAQLQGLTATVIGGNTGVQVFGTLQAGYTNNVFSYTLTWSGPSADVQELGWAFQMPSTCDHFSWNRSARWSVYPASDIGRAAGVATPDTTNVDATDMDITNAFDFNSTKYDCYWATLATAGGDGLRLQFGPQQLFHCRAGGASGGGYLLFANQQVSPPDDYGEKVPDLFMTLTSGNVVQGSFTVGSNTELPVPGGSDLGAVQILAPSGGGGGGGGSSVEVNFSGSTNASYSVWASSNLLNWQWAGAATEIAPGQYQFTDPSATNYAHRFYRASAP